ncbi:hypothetical protein [uncultured Clostridium sp.]|jgi:hypothetical protein|uniref:hypothetical protein n=1 Tax=uncultured Clostridium sp. TaxID=59620 RepID=UPI00260FE86C|nr:hypothetical protein [uncultured Clostridium sp.]
MGKDSIALSSVLLNDILSFDTIRSLRLDKFDKEEFLNMILALGEANKNLKAKCKELYNSYFGTGSYDFYEAELRVRRLTEIYL